VWRVTAQLSAVPDVHFQYQKFARLSYFFLSRTSSTHSLYRVQGYCCIWSHSLGLLLTSDQLVTDTSTCKTNKTHLRRTSMPPSGCEPIIPACERPHIHGLRPRGHSAWLPGFKHITWGTVAVSQVSKFSRDVMSSHVGVLCRDTWGVLCRDTWGMLCRHTWGMLCRDMWGMLCRDTWGMLCRDTWQIVNVSNESCAFVSRVNIDVQTNTHCCVQHLHKLVGCVYSLLLCQYSRWLRHYTFRKVLCRFH
jgi:hypothetical protein